MASVGRGYIAKQSQTGEFEPNCQSFAAVVALMDFSTAQPSQPSVFNTGQKEKPQEYKYIIYIIIWYIIYLFI